MVPLLTACLLLMPPASAGAPVVRFLDIAGNTAFPAREILSWLSTRPGTPFSEQALQTDITRIRDAYVAVGYYDVALDTVEREISADSAGIRLRLVLQEGKRTTVGSVRFTGATVLSEEELLTLLETRPGSPLDTRLLENDIDAVLRRYEREGYPYASCRIDSLDRRPGPEEDALAVVLAVSEGRHVTIDEVRVQGLVETRPDVVVRETRFDAGEQFDPGKVDAIRPRLQRLNLFEDVSEPELYVRGGLDGLLIRVREGNTNTFDGVAGYVPGTRAGETGYLTGLASVSMRNLFGTGRKFSFRWQREDRLSQELGLRYTEPWLLGQPVNLGGGFLQRKQDTTFVKRVVDVKGELMLTDVLSVGLLFSAESVIPADSAGSRVLRSSVMAAGADLQYDTRNDPYAPTAGSRYRSDYQHGSRRVTHPPDAKGPASAERTTIQRFGLDADLYFSTFTRQVLAVGLHGREVRSGSLDESELLRFGGARSLRGYRESQFTGARIAWTNLEYRFMLGRRTFLAGFLDTGYLYRPPDERLGTSKTDDVKLGYGLALQVEAGLGMIAVSFALGEGDSFSSAKVHLGLINEF